MIRNKAPNGTPKTAWSLRGGIAVAVLVLSPAAMSDAVVLYEDHVVSITPTLADPTDLWVPTAELTRVNGFELKPEGACLDDICVPVRQDQDSEIYLTRGGESWFNVAELAERLGQPYVADYEVGVWSFGAIPVHTSKLVDRAEAPDFELPDANGKTYRLSDFKGRKIMLLSWASW